MITFEKDEKVIREIRRHWFYIALRIAVLSFLAAFPLVIFAAITVVGSALLDRQVVIFAALIYTFYLLVLWISFFIFLTTYRLDVWYVTNKRIIDVEQHALFSREVTTLHYDRIQDVTVEVNGLVATFFGYGTLHVQTAGDDREIILDLVEAPYDAKQTINEQLARRDDAVEELHEAIKRAV